MYDPLSEPSVGIVGISPKGSRGPRVYRDLAVFQADHGELEAAPPGSWWAGHAACHAFVNGLSRVVFGGVDRLDDGPSLARALQAMLEADDAPDALVAPGVIEAAEPLVAAYRSSSAAARSDPPTLWLDAPDRSSIEDVIARQHALSGQPGQVRVPVRVVIPWVETISPGRRSPERLPASCLVVPLALGMTPALKGAHTLDRGPGPATRARLAEAGCGLLVRGSTRRRLVRLAFPAPRKPSEPEPPPLDLKGRVEQALEEACLPLIGGAANGPTLWRSLTRNAKATLERFKRTGEIAGYVVRCDQETNQDVVGGVAMDVVVRVPKRVNELIIRLQLG